MVCDLLAREVLLTGETSCLKSTMLKIVWQRCTQVVLQCFGIHCILFLFLSRKLFRKAAPIECTYMENKLSLIKIFQCLKKE